MTFSDISDDDRVLFEVDARTRFLGPALGSVHMFFHRLGPVLARRMLLTGDIVEAGTMEHLGIFTEA